MMHPRATGVAGVGVKAVMGVGLTGAGATVRMQASDFVFVRTLLQQSRSSAALPYTLISHR